MNLIGMISAALKPQVAKLDPEARRLIILQIHDLTAALLAGDRGSALLALEAIGAEPGLIDLVLDNFLVTGGENDVSG